METSKIIQVFPQVLKTHSEKFELEDLQDLDQTLTALETQIEPELVKLLEDWFKTHIKVRDTLRPFAEAKKELKYLLPLPLNSEAGILQNLFELRQTNKEIITAKTNQQQPADKNVKK